MHSNKFACEVPFVVSSTLTHLKKFFLLFVQTSELQNMKHTLPKKEDKKIQQDISHTIVHSMRNLHRYVPILMQCKDVQLTSESTDYYKNNVFGVPTMC